jgi:hypothetical protein
VGEEGQVEHRGGDAPLAVEEGQGRETAGSGIQHHTDRPSIDRNPLDGVDDRQDRRQRQDPAHHIHPRSRVARLGQEHRPQDEQQRHERNVDDEN